MLSAIRYIWKLWSCKPRYKWFTVFHEEIYKEELQASCRLLKVEFPEFPSENLSKAAWGRVGTVLSDGKCELSIQIWSRNGFSPGRLCHWKGRSWRKISWQACTALSSSPGSSLLTHWYTWSSPLLLWCFGAHWYILCTLVHLCINVYRLADTLLQNQLLLTVKCW